MKKSMTKEEMRDFVRVLCNDRDKKLVLDEELNTLLDISYAHHVNLVSQANPSLVATWDEIVYSSGSEYISLDDPNKMGFNPMGILMIENVTDADNHQPLYPTSIQGKFPTASDYSGRYYYHFVGSALWLTPKPTSNLTLRIFYRHEFETEFMTDYSRIDALCECTCYYTALLALGIDEKDNGLIARSYADLRQIMLAKVMRREQTGKSMTFHDYGN